jgi:hypothetical protein
MLCRNRSRGSVCLFWEWFRWECHDRDQGRVGHLEAAIEPVGKTISTMQMLPAKKDRSIRSRSQVSGWNCQRTSLPGMCPQSHTGFDTGKRNLDHRTTRKETDREGILVLASERKSTGLDK